MFYGSELFYGSEGLFSLSAGLPVEWGSGAGDSEIRSIVNTYQCKNKL